MPDREALWRFRLRWRWRGAWMWPAFAATTVLDAVVLSRLPFAGGRGDLPGAVLVAGFLNLMAVAVVGRAGGALLARRGTLPREVAADRAGTAGLLALSALLVAGGLAHRPAVRAEDAARTAAVAAARQFAGHHAPRAYLAGLTRSSTWREGPHLFRTCLPGPDERRAWCMFVDTERRPPSVVRDPDQRPNGER
jgi:hypothetical protein